MCIPSDLTREGVEHYRERVEGVLNRLTVEAEAWAEAGSEKTGQRRLRRQSAPRPTSAAELRVHQPLSGAA
jgi:hypothetical protein